MKNQKFYVVWKGRNPGIYSSWDDCEVQIIKFEGAAYKAFETRIDAEVAYAGNSNAFIYKKTNIATTKSSKVKGKPNLKSISVDAAWNTKTKIMEYQGVVTNTKELIFRKGPFQDATNNIGEFLAIVHGLALLKQRNSDLPIYSDSMTAIKWVKDAYANTKLLETDNNSEIFELIERAEFWLKNNTYTTKILKWETEAWGEIPADFGRK